MLIDFNNQYRYTKSYIPDSFDPEMHYAVILLAGLTYPAV